MGQRIILKNVRCSFPQLYRAETRGEQTFDTGITVLLDPKKDAGQLTEIKNAINQEIAENTQLKRKPPSGEKLCLRPGNRDEYPEGHLMLRANSKRPPVVLHKNMEKMTEADNKIYSGCYVNVKIEIWGQSNQLGKRVNAKLLAVQFAGDGESFDGSYVSEETAVEGFGSLGDDSEDDSILG